MLLLGYGIESRDSWRETGIKEHVLEEISRGSVKDNLNLVYASKAPKKGCVVLIASGLMGRVNSLRKRRLPPS